MLIHFLIILLLFELTLYFIILLIALIIVFSSVGYFVGKIAFNKMRRKRRNWLEKRTTKRMKRLFTCQTVLWRSLIKQQN